MIGPSPGRSWAEFIERDRERWRRRALPAEKALREIAEQDPVELALDPEWPQRIARAALNGSGDVPGNQPDPFPTEAKDLETTKARSGNRTHDLFLTMKGRPGVEYGNRLYQAEKTAQDHTRAQARAQTECSGNVPECPDCPEPLECPDCGGECGPSHDSWACDTCGVVW